MNCLADNTSSPVQDVYSPVKVFSMRGDVCDRMASSMNSVGVITSVRPTLVDMKAGEL